MREAKRLNKLLFDNMKPLEIVFEKFKQGAKPTFSLNAANKLLLDLKHETLTITVLTIEQAFVFCMMTVTNEINNMRKYSYLVFVEFLDMLCRIAIVAIQLADSDKIEDKVYQLLKIMRDKFKEDNVLAVDFRPVDEDYDFGETADEPDATSAND